MAKAVKNPGAPAGSRVNLKTKKTKTKTSVFIRGRNKSLPYAPILHCVIFKALTLKPIFEIKIPDNTAVAAPAIPQVIVQGYNKASIIPNRTPCQIKLILGLPTLENIEPVVPAIDLNRAAT